MVAFKGGNNTGGQNVDYYDNPNYDPKKDGKSSTDYIKNQANKSADWAETANYQYYEVGAGEYDDVIEAEGEAAYDKVKADKQTSDTVSYFRARERERLNPGGVGGPQINPKFSKPASLSDKLAKFGFSYDPTNPDTFFEEVFRLPDKVVSENKTRAFDTGSFRGIKGWNEETMEFLKDKPMPNTVAGVNQELQARKARTRDFAMEFKGTVYDFINEVKSGLLDEVDEAVNDNIFSSERRQPLSNNELENKYFPEDASKKEAKRQLQKMISFTDEASDISRNYSSLSQYAATIVGDTAKTPAAIIDHMIRGPIGEKKWIDEKLTKVNYEKGLKEFQAWKSKKGIPKIIRLVSKLG